MFEQLLCRRPIHGIQSHDSTEKLLVFRREFFVFHLEKRLPKILLFYVDVDRSQNLFPFLV